MGVNKVEYGSSTLVDLTGDTVTPETLLQGETAHNAAGNRITGTARPGVQTFNGRSGSVLPIAGDYSADQVNYDSNKTVKQVIDALVTKEASDIAGQQSLLKDTVGWTGKNKLDNKAVNTTSNGITFTVNSDKSVTANGTATADAYCTLTPQKFDASIFNGYILSGCPAGGSGSKYHVYICLNADPYTHYAHDDGEGAVVNSPIGVMSKAYIRIKSGQTVNNLVFKPMLRKADITDPTYEPYHESVETMYEEEIHGVNLLTLEACFSDISGVTRTINSDNSVTINGTATNTKNVYFSQRFVKSATTLDVGRYILSVGASIPSTCRLHVSYSAIDGSNVVVAWGDYGANTITFDAPIKDRPWNVLMEVGNGTNFNNLILYPMLRKADIEDSTYRPYNHQAIQNQLNAQGVLGAKNLLPNRMNNGTNNGITFSVNADGSFSMNGTVSSSSDVSGYYICNDFKLSNGNYIFSTHETSDGRNIHYFIAKMLNGSYVSSITEIQYNDNVPFTINYDDTYDSIRVAVWIRRGTTINNKTAYPMIRLASDPDDTYQPYAMTNRELTEKKAGLYTKGDTFNCGLSLTGHITTGTTKLELTLRGNFDKANIRNISVGTTPLLIRGIKGYLKTDNAVELNNVLFSDYLKLDAFYIFPQHIDLRIGLISGGAFTNVDNNALIDIQNMTLILS